MLKINEYTKTVRRPYPPFYGGLILSGMANRKHYREPYAENFPTIQNEIQSDSDWHYSKKELEAVGHAILKVWSEPVRLEKGKNVFVEQEKKLIKAASGTDLKKFCNVCEEYMPAICVWTADGPVAEEIRKKLLSKLSEKETDELLGKLNVPLQDNFYKKEVYDLLNSKNIEAHVREYEWINSRYGSREPYTTEQALIKLKGINKQEFLEKWRREKGELKKNIEYAKEVLGGDAVLVDLMQFIIYYRTQRTDIINKSSYLFAGRLEEVAKGKGLTYEQILYCLRSEIEGALPSVKEINSRIKDCAIIMEDGRVRCASGAESQKIREFFKVDTTNVSELVGISACRGKVIGQARLIFKKEDLKRVKEGTILVTSMTTPNMISAMHRAAAFVTDEGGITCHAAIISREMGKPCIIGTKIATKVLKDGDLVEVDADNGIVKKLG